MKRILFLALALTLAGAFPVGARDVAMQVVTLSLSPNDPVSLQVGSAAAVDAVSFSVSTPPNSSGGAPVPGTSSGAYPVPFIITGNWSGTKQLTLTANTSTPMSGAGGTIPFTTISCASGQVLFRKSFKDTDTIQGTMAFSYDNKNYYTAGSYTGQVTFTLTQP
jgi:hypothetical protein